MTRAVVVSPYPPTPDVRGDVALAKVRALRAAGYIVDVASPQPSAAQWHANPESCVGAIRLRRIVAGADLVVLVVSAGAAPDSSRVRGRCAAWLLSRSLERAVTVETVAVDGGCRADVQARALSWATVRRIRAGAPTFVRTLRARR